MIKHNEEIKRNEIHEELKQEPSNVSDQSSDNQLASSSL